MGAAGAGGGGRRVCPCVLGDAVEDRLKTQQLFPGVLFEWQVLFRSNSLGAQFSGQKYLVARTKVQILTLVRTLG